ncbi:hypothetical protein SH668x_002119 [Planctomicrobium sp. SH668]|uniref:hypothetical protein n=1 Tax=Planctomicrobium sp. SH668 TaxID=3448126 RepID=UPI003F5AF888
MLCWNHCFRILLLATPVLLLPAVTHAQFVPGSGTFLIGDDLEDPTFTYTANLPKSSKEEDEQVRYPLGFSSNGMWFESPKRGSPDSIKWVETPAGGIPGSKGCLYMRTRDSGIPGSPGYNLRKENQNQAQDDFIMKAHPVNVSSSPSTTVRVYLPEWSQWEQRNGVSFGYRVGLQGPMEKDSPSVSRRLFGRGRPNKVTEIEPYYPGFFIHFVPEKDPMNKKGHAYAMLLLRANELGHEMQGPVIDEPGWWTLGMSVTPDGRLHYYARAGVEDLTQADYIRSSLPYNIRGTTFNTIFFNVCSADNGQSWSTPWIIDEPKVFYGTVRQNLQAQRPGATAP